MPPKVKSQGRPAPSTPTRTSLQDVFNDDMLNIQLAFLESRVGVARRVRAGSGEQLREYKIDGCDVTAHVKNNEVVGYGLILGGPEPWRSAKSNCNVEIPRGSGLRTNGLTTGKFINTMGLGIASPNALFQASCISMCGNAADPTVTFHWDGPHAVGFMNIDVVSIIAYGQSLDAVEKWRTLMTKNEGEDYVIHTRFNCDGNYERLGLELFQNVEVYEIIVRATERPAEPGNRACARHY